MKRLVATALVALMLASCQEAPKGWRSDRQDGRESLSQVLPE